MSPTSPAMLQEDTTATGASPAQQTNGRMVSLTSEEKKNSQRFLLVYGSATGQAQAIAEEIAEKALGFNLSPELFPLEDTGKKFNIENEPCIVIVTSTTGDGDAPGNAEKFMRRIKKRTLPSDYLAHLQYALLGLGDTNYSSFCRCAKDLEARLQALGARPFYPSGFADDGVGLEVVAEPWLEGVYPALQKFLGAMETTGGLSEKVMASTGSGDAPIVKTSHDSNTEQTKSSPADLKNILKVSNSYSNDNTGKDNSNENNSHSSTNDKETLIADSASLADLLLQTTFFNKQSEIETQCQKSELSTEERRTCDLCALNVSLLDKNLTIPVLPPKFLDALFTKEVVKLDELNHQNDLKLPLAASSVKKVKVVSAKVMTCQDAVKKALCLSMDMKNCDIDYQPGDSISIICPNSCSEVNLLLERLGVSDQADICMTLSVTPDTTKRRAAVPPHTPSRSTLRHVLTTCCNIREPPSKAMIRALLEHTSDPQEGQRITQLCSKDGAQDYTRSVREKHLSLLDFLYIFPSCSPPVERILEFLPRLQPRPYSACSCPLVDTDRLDVVFNVLDLPACPGEGHMYSRKGVCTGWLDDLTQGLQGGDDGEAVLQVPIFLRTNQHFRPPTDLSKPLIMIGPGTGVAPFVGFLRERQHRKNLESTAVYGETWLFYGCRHKEKDFLFREELDTSASNGVLTHLCVAVSREEGHDLSPHCRYVQDYLRHHSSHMARLLHEEEALVYVCGDATGMAKDVSQALEDILVQEKGLSKEEANMFLMKKRLNKTLFEDVWT